MTQENTSNGSYNVEVASYSGYNCLCQSVSRNTTADEYEAKDESGVTAVYVFANKKDTVTLELIINNIYTPPTIGETITVGGNSYYVQSTTLTESNTDFKKCSVTGIRFIDGELPGTGTSSSSSEASSSSSSEVSE